jgi:O-antigen/teichoic acid export membrane protein
LLSDFCIGISVQNHISERRAMASDSEDIVLTGAILSLGAACLMGVILLLLGPWLAQLLLGEFSFLSPAGRTLAFYAMAFPAIGTALGGVMYRIWFARHRGYLSNLLPAAGTVIGTFGVWVLQHFQGEPKIALATLAYYTPLAILPMIALCASTVRAARGHHRFARSQVKPILGRALRFWASGLLAASVLQVDYIIMVKALNVRDIVVYSVATKLFLLIFFVYNALLQALWPICSESIARHDWHNVFSSSRKYISFGVGFTLLCGILVALANKLIVHVIAPGLNTPIPLTVIGLLTLYIVIRVWTDTFAMILQSMNDLLLMWLVAPVQSLLSISLQFLGARYFGLPGMIFGLIACFVLTAAWMLPLRCWLHARRASAPA